MTPKSPYRRGRLAPRCRLITSWGWSRSQGYGCSPFTVVRELGLARRYPVRSLSTFCVGHFLGSVPITTVPVFPLLCFTVFLLISFSFFLLLLFLSPSFF